MRAFWWSTENYPAGKTDQAAEWCETPPPSQMEVGTQTQQPLEVLGGLGWLWVPLDLLLSPCCGHRWVGSPHPTAHVDSGVVLGSLLESTRKIRIHLRAPEQ